MGLDTTMLAAMETNAAENMTRTGAGHGDGSFTEAPAWRPVGDGWRQLHGNFRDEGYSIEWHDFNAERDFDWSRSFHPAALEICLNLAGRGEVQTRRRTLELAPASVGFYFQNGPRLAATRSGGERHQFVTLELSLPFLERQVRREGGGLHPDLNRALSRPRNSSAMVSEPAHLTSEQQRLAMSLRHPPVYAAAQPLWYRAKALELAAALLYQPGPGEELFCQRVKQLNRERVQKVMGILRENLAEPPALEEIGRRVGCSHFYLSRIFAQETGRTIFAVLRDLRMERAAEFLREGRMNVTEAAMEVGYSSLSHFTVAFRETFSCCPGLYPLKARARNFKH
jgi:AraC-like DNA-binding protein